MSGSSAPKSALQYLPFAATNSDWAHPDYHGVISAKTHHVNNDYSGFEGMVIEGRPSVVTVRGKVQVKDGKFVGERGRGRMLKREPSYF